MRRSTVTVGVILSVLAVAGAGFAAFTAHAQVNGAAVLGSVSLVIKQTPYEGSMCIYTTNFSVTHEPTVTLATNGTNESTLTFENMLPQTECITHYNVNDTGTGPVFLDVEIRSMTNVCTTSAIVGCYVVVTGSGVNSQSRLSVNQFAIVTPGDGYADSIAVFAYSNDLPDAATFTVGYSGVSI